MSQLTGSCSLVGHVHGALSLAQRAPLIVEAHRRVELLVDGVGADAREATVELQEVINLIGLRRRIHGLVDHLTVATP